ncbi:MAG: hypothetical protein KJO43_05830 [Phycisphaerae bacterium]|nr:hypothetical protein [Phycisphaerae bacterium]NNF41502.1 hypothetical protein [Phycisphaerales bacterium]
MLTIAQSSEFLPGSDLTVIVAMVVGLFMVSLLIGGLVFRSVAIQRAREETRRDLAAYVAEGSMKPADAIEMLRTEPGTKKPKAATAVAEELGEAVCAFAAKIG